MYSDPWGLDTVQIGWRLLYNTLGRGSYVHFAIRTGGNGKWHGAELIPDAEYGNNIRGFNGEPAGTEQYHWSNLPTPAGQTDDEYSHNVRKQTGVVGAAYSQKKYSNGDSNLYVHDVVKAANGKIPRRVADSPAPRTAPGICGGVAAAGQVGNDCSQ